MSEKLDAIIFGATGFTGKIAVEDAVELFKDLKWGIAGRNRSKLQNLLKDVGAKVKKDLSAVPIIIAEIDDVKSIEAMAQRCKILLNCCGPYRFFGEVVVKACAEAGTHHIDITGETDFVYEMQMKYDDVAKRTGAYIVSACGFDSIPAEMGVVYAERKFPGTINSVEMFLENRIDYKDKNSKAVGTFGTWESAVYALKIGIKLLSLEKQMNAKSPVLQPQLHASFFVEKPTFLSSHFLPFPATDRAMVANSQRQLYELTEKRPIQFECYVGFKSICWKLFLPIYAVFLFIMAQCSFTRKQLLKHSKLFTFGLITHEGITEGNKDAHHFSLTYRVRGWAEGTDLTNKPNKEMYVRVSGCGPYAVSSVTLLSAAKVLLEERDKIPGNAGVLSPGAAFAKTSLIEKLSQQSKYGLKFEVL